MTEVVKESGIAWIGRVPASWDVVMLKRTTYLKGRIGWQGLTTDEYLADGDCLLVTGTDFEGGRIQWPRCPYVNRERYDEDPYIQLKEGDLLVTKDGTIGKVATVRRLPKPATLNSGVFVTRPLHGRYRQEFLYWVLVSDVFPEFIRYSMVGTTINHLYQKTFERFVYALPPLSEQQRIAAYLDASCAAIDAAVAAKRRQLDTLGELLKTIMHAAVTRGLNEPERLKDSGHAWFGQIPIDWQLVAIKRIVSTKITDGPHETPELADTGAQFISAEAIKNGHIDFNLRRGFISWELHEQYCRKCKPQKRDIFVVKSGATTGNVAYVDVDFEFSIWSPLALIRCDERIAFYKFIYYVLLTNVFRKQVELSWSFGTQQNIGMRVIERLKVPLPSIAEQRQIAAFLDDELSKASEIRANIESQIATLTSYRKSLIHECVTGQRRVTEADVTAAQRVEPSLSKLRQI